METKVPTMSFFRRLWQKLFHRVDDVYVFSQPPGTPSASSSPTKSTGLVEAVDITATASFDVLNGHLYCNGKVHKSSAAEATSTNCATPACAIVAAAPRAASLRPLYKSRGGSLSNDDCSVSPFYSINTDPLDLQLVAADGSASNTGFDAAAESATDYEHRFVGAFWQRLRSADDSAQERSRNSMGVPLRLDPAVVCDLDSGPFDRSCHENVFFVASYEQS